MQNLVDKMVVLSVNQSHNENKSSLGLINMTGTSAFWMALRSGGPNKMSSKP